ncbi:hypothetical protein C8Q79DRAFT_1105639 [Trametes meyenii]|nr:hypothetical protein C8Q79DRAFT_1105639 [Trametes meyenii]
MGPLGSPWGDTKETSRARVPKESLVAFCRIILVSRHSLLTPYRSTKFHILIMPYIETRDYSTEELSGKLCLSRATVLLISRESQPGAPFTNVAIIMADEVPSSAAPAHIDQTTTTEGLPLNQRTLLLFRIPPATYLQEDREAKDHALLEAVRQRHGIQGPIHEAVANIDIAAEIIHAAVNSALDNDPFGEWELKPETKDIANFKDVLQRYKAVGEYLTFQLSWNPPTLSGVRWYSPCTVGILVIFGRLMPSTEGWYDVYDRATGTRRDTDFPPWGKGPRTQGRRQGV